MSVHIILFHNAEKSIAQRLFRSGGGSYATVVLNQKYAITEFAKHLVPPHSYIIILPSCQLGIFQVRLKRSKERSDAMENLQRHTVSGLRHICELLGTPEPEDETHVAEMVCKSIGIQRQNERNHVKPSLLVAPTVSSCEVRSYLQFLPDSTVQDR